MKNKAKEENAFNIWHLVKKKTKCQTQKGITLIALIITVIILLILAGTAISISINGEDLFGRSQNAVAQYNNKADEEEKKINDLWNILNSINGGISPSDKLSEEQLKTKIMNEDEDCGIDENGNIIPINVWNYVVNDEDETATLEGTYEYDDWDAEYHMTGNAYKGNIINGKLEHEIPVYLKISNKPYKVTELGYLAFCGMTFNSFLIPNNIITIGSQSFYGAKIPNLEVPDSVKKISTEAFKRFDGNVILGKSVERIEGEAFQQSNITSITIPSSVKYIGRNAFFDCNLLENIIIESPNDWIWKRWHNGSEIETSINLSTSQIKNYADEYLKME